MKKTPKFYLAVIGFTATMAACGCKKDDTPAPVQTHQNVVMDDGQQNPLPPPIKP